MTGRHWLPRTVAVIGFVALGMIGSVGVAEAHERREVAGYDFVVGFEGEPALEGQPNAALLRVSRNDAPVEGLEQTLEVEITHVGSNVSQVFPLNASFGEPGTYTADLIPTSSGAYRFRFFGTIEGEAIDETFESGENTFSNIESVQDLQFPETLASSREVQGVAQGAQTAALDAGDEASSARTLAMAALGVGALGVVVGGVGVAMAARRRA